MDYEKAHKETLEKIRAIYYKLKFSARIEDAKLAEKLEEIFFELKESEDEKIRKALIRYFTLSDEQAYNEACGVSYRDIVAWLEKQKELTSDEEKQGKEDVLWCINQSKQHAKDENEMGTCWFAEKWLEKQGEQKPTIIIPKFRIGDKIRRKTPRLYDRDMQVARVESGYYICNHLGNFSSESVSFSEESNYELVEQKPANSYCREHCKGYQETGKCFADGDCKDKVEAEHKSWSEDDEQYLLVCKNALAKYQTTDKWDAHIIFNWLENKFKSLRHQNSNNL